MKLSSKKQRSTKAEREAAQQVLASLYRKAFEDGEVKLSYAHYGKDGADKARIIHQALADYRKIIKRRQTENFEHFIEVNACELRRSSEYEVTLIKKPGRYSERTQIILDVLAERPELELLKPKVTGLDSANIAATIAATFKHGGENN